MKGVKHGSNLIQPPESSAENFKSSCAEDRPEGSSKTVSEYDQEILQSQTADKPMVS